jgi:DNA-binding NtrC family response regulator
MPRRTGLETIQAVREVDAELPCILISGGLDEHLRRQAEAADVFGILEKPVRLDAVTSVVAQAFQRRWDWVF